MLIGARFDDLGCGALRDLRQAPAVFVSRVVTAFFIDCQITWKENDLPVGAQTGPAIGGFEIDGGALDPRLGHL